VADNPLPVLASEGVDLHMSQSASQSAVECELRELEGLRRQLRQAIEPAWRSLPQSGRVGPALETDGRCRLGGLAPQHAQGQASARARLSGSDLYDDRFFFAHAQPIADRQSLASAAHAACDQRVSAPQLVPIIDQRLPPFSDMATPCPPPPAS
jgi:hypothetical protein